MSQGYSAQTVQSLEDLFAESGVWWKSKRRGINDPTLLVRRIISSRHAKLEHLV